MPNSPGDVDALLNKEENWREVLKKGRAARVHVGVETICPFEE